jgi:hypothetical protein
VGVRVIVVVASDQIITGGEEPLDVDADVELAVDVGGVLVGGVDVGGVLVGGVEVGGVLVGGVLVGGVTLEVVLVAPPGTGRAWQVHSPPGGHGRTACRPLSMKGTDELRATMGLTRTATRQPPARSTAGHSTFDTSAGKLASSASCPPWLETTSLPSASPPGSRTL